MKEDRPNLLLILTDHWRGDCLGRLGHPAVETPHVDSISGEGVTFTNAFTPCASCIAARRSIMTGMTPNTHGMLGYEDGRPWPYRRTLAGELARAGYQTVNVGKTHFFPRRLRLGFEELIVPADYDEWLAHETGLRGARFAHGVHQNSWMARPTHLRETQTQECWYVDRAIERLEKRDPTRPFFLCLSFNGPHPPWCPPAWYFDLFMAKDLPPPMVGDWARHYADEARYPLDVNTYKGRLSPELNHRARAGYFACLAWIDAQIGRFMLFLAQRRLFENTLILFTSDHGEMLGDHNLWRKVNACDPSARVPFILRMPAGRRARANEHDDSPVGLEDIMPTLLDAAGVPAPEPVEGRSVLPLLRGEPAGWRAYYHHEHAPFYEPDYAYQCLTSRDWKYIWNPITGAELLFDRRADPYELHDLSAEPDPADALRDWRATLAATLAGRPEGMSDGTALRTGDVPTWRPPAAAVARAQTHR
ncbi:MAG: sulfatase-like hydrolase/transferase [Kiritimatiellae bacterium]|nr:sulfatase-like hydrolase/transferase [Kiritimatiellia bacterium]